MRTILLVFALAIAACAPRVIQVPAAAPASPAPATQQPAKNQAVAFATSWLPLIDPAIECVARTGREAPIPSAVDTCVCTSQAHRFKLGCIAPDDGSPKCEPIADWGARQPAPAAAEPAADSAKPAPAAGKSTKSPAK